ncbi:hypothetical protein ACLESO_20495 [Pyxidicoccus sp. 3LG]
MRHRSPLMTALCSAALLSLLGCNGKSELSQDNGAGPVPDESPSTETPPIQVPQLPGDSNDDETPTSHADADARPHADADADADAHPDADSNSNSNSNADPHAAAAAPVHAHPLGGPQRQ